MAIKGCVHDGWLLIRDAQKHFDPIFLCHMLGAPQMLNEYRMFAAGSTVNNLNKELVGNAIVSLPSKNEQHEIGIALDPRIRSSPFISVSIVVLLLGC